MIEHDFWSQVEKTDYCWLWKGDVNEDGYGVFYYPGTWVATPVYRIAFALLCGAIPRGAIVCHTCDNRLCCNPAHLWLGTRQSNMTDKIAKGRQARGEQHGRAKLSQQTVQEIRERYGRGDVTLRQLGAQYNVCCSTVHYVVNGKRWRERA